MQDKQDQMPLKYDLMIPGGAVLAALVVSVVALGPIQVQAADGEIKPGPPGVIIEPVRPRPDGPKSAPAPDADVREPAAPGCPANDRKLELLV